MENYDQLLGMNAPLTSAFRSLSPSILAKRQIRQNPQNLSQLMPQQPQMPMPGGGLGSLQNLGQLLMGNMAPKDDTYSGQTSLYGGM